MNDTPSEALLPEGLRFPKPPFRIDPPPGGEEFRVACADYVQLVAEWRNAVIDAVNSSAEGDDSLGLSSRAKLALLVFLQPRWPEQYEAWADASPYNISAFPEESTGEETDLLNRLLELLRWRAGFLDYLSDVWDVWGEPDLEIVECGAIERFLTPAGSETLCPFCLMPFEGDAIHVDQHGCVMLDHVRAKWPPMPFNDPD